MRIISSRWGFRIEPSLSLSPRPRTRSLNECIRGMKETALYAFTAASGVGVVNPLAEWPSRTRPSRCRYPVCLIGRMRPKTKRKSIKWWDFIPSGLRSKAEKAVEIHNSQSFNMVWPFSHLFCIYTRIQGKNVYTHVFADFSQSQKWLCNSDPSSSILYMN